MYAGQFLEGDASAVVQTLQRLRGAGKKTFLLTNNLYEYTNVVLKHIVQSRSVLFLQYECNDGLSWALLLAINHSPCHSVLTLFL